MPCVEIGNSWQTRWADLLIFSISRVCSSRIVAICMSFDSRSWTWASVAFFFPRQTSSSLDFISFPVNLRSWACLSSIVDFSRWTYSNSAVSATLESVSFSFTDWRPAFDLATFCNFYLAREPVAEGQRSGDTALGKRRFPWRLPSSSSGGKMLFCRGGTGDLLFRPQRVRSQPFFLLFGMFLFFFYPIPQSLLVRS